MILERRPHKLTIYQQTPGHTEDNGDFVPGSEQAIATIGCLAEPNGKAEVVEIDGGERKVYSFHITTDPRCPDLLVGTSVRLERMGREYTFNVLGFQRYQHSCQIWV